MRAAGSVRWKRSGRTCGGPLSRRAPLRPDGPGDDPRRALGETHRDTGGTMGKKKKDKKKKGKKGKKK